MYIGDLHIHSRYSRATSKEPIPGHLDLRARKKGIHIVGTGGFTHQVWRAELEQKLEPAESGLYVLKKEWEICHPSAAAENKPRFVITGEISSVYKKNGKMCKAHSLVLLPSLEAAEVLSRRLEAVGDIHSDGRPILGLDCHDLLAITLDAYSETIYVPAHIWTPHSSLFGAFSGFDTIEECYEELTPQIYALETRLSPDPTMNQRLSALGSYQLISNSDAHSPAKLGREANLLDIAMLYEGFYGAVQRGEGLAETIEFFPGEGKYHFDGHRRCHLCLSPSQVRQCNGTCPVCGRKLATGVLHRIEQLADRQETFRLPGGRPYESLVPLPEVIAGCMGTSSGSVKVVRQYEHILEELGDEFHILRKVSLDDISRIEGQFTVQGIRHLREGQVEWRPGYDGEYGTMKLFGAAELDNVEGQLSFILDEEDTPSDDSNPLSADLSYAEESKQPQMLSARTNEPDPISSAVAAPVILDPSDNHPSLAGLNQGQHQAIQSIAPVTAVIAGPGTGETKTLVFRLAYLLGERGVKPGEITTITFTNRAVEELRQRTHQQLPGKDRLTQMQVGTSHSLCYRMLLADGTDLVLADEGQLEECAFQAVEQLSLSCSARQFLAMVSLHKSGIQTPDIGEAFRLYDTLLADHHIMDFDDLLLNVLERLESEQSSQLRKKHFFYLLVDEFQDISPIQYRLIRAWCKRDKELFLIGDPDQSIYGFRDSQSNCFDFLSADFEQVNTLRLKPNYRSTPEILAAALPLISRNPGGEREPEPMLSHGSPVRVAAAKTSLSEAIFTAKEIGHMVGGIDMLNAHTNAAHLLDTPRSFGDTAILYRTNHQAKLLGECLRKEGIPYVVPGREDYLSDPFVQGTICSFRGLLQYFRDKNASQWEQIKALCCKLLSSSHNHETLKEAYSGCLKREKPWKILEDWRRGLKLCDSKATETLACMLYFHKTMEDMIHTLTFGQGNDVTRSGQDSCPSSAVTLMAFHASKGLEFLAVFLYGLKQGLMLLKSGSGPVDWEEEQRLPCVAMTCAKEELVLTTSEEPSPFLSEIPQDTCRTEQAHIPGDGMKQLSLFDFNLM